MPFPPSTPSTAYPHHRQVAPLATSSSSPLAISTASATAPSVSKDRPLTSTLLLKLNAGALDPKIAALEQAINDRNTLSAQNAQLWKLIEKQRAGYNKILKELERVRGERDAFKAKLGLSTSNSSGGGDRRRRSNDVERPSKQSVADKSLSSRAESDTDHSRQAVARHNSDDQRTFTLSLRKIVD
jgi:RalA-binding protein 1